MINAHEITNANEIQSLLGFMQPALKAVRIARTTTLPDSSYEKALRETKTAARTFLGMKKRKDTKRT